MNAYASAVRELEPRSVEWILSRLCALRRDHWRGSDFELPRVTLHLRGGGALTGWAIELVVDRAGPVLLFQPSESGRPGADATYVEAANVAAVTVHDAGAVAHVLEPHRVRSRPGETAPASWLELRRHAADTSNMFSEETNLRTVFEIAKDGAPDEGEALSILRRMVTETAAALVRISREELGREAILDQAKQVVIRGGPELAAMSSAGTLTVTTPLGRNALERLSELKSVLEKAL